MNKYIQLYEDYTQMMQEVSSKGHSWSDFRDAINLKKPFMIIDFENEDSSDQFISSEMAGQDYEMQKYHLKLDNTEIKEYPSVFVFLESSAKPDRIRGLLKRFKIMRIITGSEGDPMTQIHTGEDSLDFASDIMTGISPDDMDRDDYYNVGSMYYRFLS